jgi:iron complex outermembrane receptor protein
MKNRRCTSSFHISYLLLGLLMLGICHSVFAQSTTKESSLETITVTAQKRSQNVKDVPISILAISQENLLENNIVAAEELSSRIGNFAVSQSGQGYNLIMRGLGSGPNQGFEQTVGSYVDGVYRGRGHLMRSSFLDLERIEILRGPQSILFGKNTVSGALNITNATPTNDLRAYININREVINDMTSVEGALSNSITSNVQGRLALRYQNGGGHLFNEAINEQQIQHDSLVGRLSFAWQPVENLKVNLSWQNESDDFIGSSNTQNIVEQALIKANAPIIAMLGNITLDDITNKTRPDLNEVEGGKFDAEHLTFQLEYQLTHFNLTAISGWQKYQINQTNDGDNSVLPILFRPLSDEKFNQFSQELRITSSSEEKFSYIAGLYYQSASLDYSEDFLAYPLQISALRDYAMDTNVWATFGQFEYAFDQNWSTIFGIRYSKEDKNAERSLDLVDPLSRASIPTMPIVMFGPLAAMPNVLRALCSYQTIYLKMANLVI